MLKFKNQLQLLVMILKMSMAQMKHIIIYTIAVNMIEKKKQLQQQQLLQQKKNVIWTVHLVRWIMQNVAKMDRRKIVAHLKMQNATMMEIKKIVVKKIKMLKQNNYQLNYFS